MALYFSNTLKCNLPNGIAGNSEMIEPITQANSLITGDLFSKNLLIFETIDSVFPL